MRTLQGWFDAYGVSHQNPTNKAIHYVCVPSIVGSILGMLYGVTFSHTHAWLFNGAVVVAGLACIYYLILSRSLGVKMIALLTGCLGGCYFLDRALPIALWKPSLGVFVLAWLGQFWGHQIEGRKPSFLEDVQFLLIGPLWVLAHLSGDDRA